MRESASGAASTQSKARTKLFAVLTSINARTSNTERRLQGWVILHRRDVLTGDDMPQLGADNDEPRRIALFVWIETRSGIA